MIFRNDSHVALHVLYLAQCKDQSTCKKGICEQAKHELYWTICSWNGRFVAQKPLCMHACIENKRLVFWTSHEFDISKNAPTPPLFMFNMIWIWGAGPCWDFPPLLLPVCCLLWGFRPFPASLLSWPLCLLRNV